MIAPMVNPAVLHANYAYTVLNAPAGRATGGRMDKGRGSWLSRLVASLRPHRPEQGAAGASGEKSMGGKKPARKSRRRYCPDIPLNGSHAEHD